MERQAVIEEGAAVSIQSALQSVFYNPAMQVNRDVSVVALNAYVRLLRSEYESDPKRLPAAEIPGVRVLEGLSATGLRSVRFAKEIDGIEEIVVNDIESEAFKSIEHLKKLNNLGDVFTPCLNDVRITMIRAVEENRLYDVIDIDPYGSCCIFSDLAISTIKPGGLLMITSTDMSIMNSTGPETCYTRYQAVPTHTGTRHEVSLRMLLGHLSRTAAKYKRIIQPLFCMSIDYYIRCVVRVFENPEEAKSSGLRNSYIFQCVQCKTPQFVPVLKQVSETKLNNNRVPAHKCPLCESPMKIGGPIWNGPIADANFLMKMDYVIDHIAVDAPMGRSVLIEAEDADKIEALTEKAAREAEYKPHICFKDRIKALTELMFGEIRVPRPLFYPIGEMTSIIRMSQPSMLKLTSALYNNKYRVARFHHEPNGIKTDAEPEFMWGMLVKLSDEDQERNGKPPRDEGLISTIRENTRHIFDKFDFSKHPQAIQDKKRRKALFPPNPTSHWGPKRARKLHTQDVLQ
ncbi:hypothetical protein PCE1_004991 [Barthelona sp. PCE]